MDDQAVMGGTYHIDGGKWPYCDGAHKYYNKETGDNVGPVVIKRKV